MTDTKLRWGVLGASKFALTKSLPALAQSQFAELRAVASRDRAKGMAAGARLGVTRVHGSYEDLLADAEIDVVYIPLPNHLHVAWSKRALEAGKHVLCEKPIALSLGELRELIAVRDRTGRLAAEAFMVAVHPQWLLVRDWIREGRLGRMVAVHGFFAYTNENPENIRNRVEYGGGGLLDIGCYPVFCSRFALGAEPTRVCAQLDHDARFGVDRMASATLDFDGVPCHFTVSTQCVPWQRMQFFGTKGRIEIEIPFNAPPDRACRVFLDDGHDLSGGGVVTASLPVCDQYAVQADEFVRAIRGEREPAVTLENSLGNMAVLEALFDAARRGEWVRC